MEIRTGVIILAAGKGTRLKSTSVNKVALPFRGRPIITYAVDVMSAVADEVVVVVGAFAESVKSALKDHPYVKFAYQKEQLGTADAAKAGLEVLLPKQPSSVLLGYGDHMMFYKTETVKKLLKFHSQNNAAVTFITVSHENPTELAWGRVIRSDDGKIEKIVEQKEANEDELTMDELNVGFYVFDTDFLKENLSKIKMTQVTKEYYITDLIEIASSQGLKVQSMEVPFSEVGIGINRPEELEASQKLYESLSGTV